jgi:hypothetical protein
MFEAMNSFWIRLHGGIGHAKNLVRDSGISRSACLILVHDTTARLFCPVTRRLISFFADRGTGPLSPSRARRHKVKPDIQHLQNVHIPTFTLPPRPTPNRRGRHRNLSHGEKITDADDNDALEDWNERASSLFEWIGMVNIGAQRYVSYPSGDDYLKAMWPQITSQRSRGSICSRLLSACPVHRWRHGAYAVARFSDSSICTEDSRYGNVTLGLCLLSFKLKLAQNTSV